MKKIVIAAPKSGSGKTFFTISLLQAFLNQNKKVSSFKCGPDYIDPLFHKSILKVPSKNLDPFFLNSEQLKKVFYSDNDSDISVIEGVMGLYDGISFESEKASTYDVAKALNAPVILVVDGKGMSYSILAQIKGYLDFDKEMLIKAVILNNISAPVFEKLKPVIEKNLNIKVLGFMPFIKDCEIQSRHLGLFLPEEIHNLEENVKKSAQILMETVNLKEIYNLDKDEKADLAAAKNSIQKNEAGEGQADSRGRNLKMLLAAPDSGLKKQERSTVKIALARDSAFCFYYQENLELLEKLGAEIVEFSPLKDKALPSGVKGLILGGGYPELFAQQLEQNKSMRNSIKAALEKGLPSLAECGGFMYLHNSLKTQDGKAYSMCGVINGDCFFADKLVRFGYVSLKEKKGEFLSENAEIKGHEFHYFDSTANGNDCIGKKSNGKTFESSFVSENHFWGFTHLYYLSNPEFAENFIERCRK